MTLSLFRPRAGVLMLSTGEYSSPQKYKKTLSFTKKQEWEFQECILSLEKGDKGFIPEIRAKGDVRIRSFCIVLPLKADWISLAGPPSHANWSFFGNRNKKEYIALAPSRSQVSIRFSEISRHRLLIEWLCDKTLLSGESWQPGMVAFLQGDPRKMVQNLELGPKKAGNRSLLRYRYFEGESRQNRASQPLKNELDKLTELGMGMDGVLLDEVVLPEPGAKPGSPAHKVLEELQTEIRKRDYKSSLLLHPLRVQKHFPFCSQHISWFLQDKKGNPLIIKEKKQSWQVLDISHKDVQAFLRERIARIRSWGFTHLLMVGLGDLFIEGRRENHHLSQSEKISLFYKVVRESAGEGCLLSGDQVFPHVKDLQWDYLFTSPRKSPGNRAICSLMHYYPLTQQGVGLCAGPLFLNAPSSRHKEIFREQRYNFQAVCGGMAILGGDGSFFDEETAEKWERLQSYHDRKTPSVIRLEPSGFLQDLIIFQSSRGILALFNHRRRMRYYHINRDSLENRKPLIFNDSTSLHSAELSIRIPSSRSRIMRF